MIVIAVLLAGLAAFFTVRVPSGPLLRRRLFVDAQEQPIPAGGGRRHGMVIVAVLLTAPTVAAVLDGPRGLCCGTAAVIIIGTVIILHRRSARRRLAAARRRAVAHSCAVLAGQVRIGQVPVVALRSAAEDCPVLAGSVATADLGGDVGAHWHRQAREPGYQGLADLARAWQLANSTGAGMAETLDGVAEALHEDEAVALVVDSEAAGPRTSGKIMALLPLMGIGLGYLIGGDPIAFLFDSPAGWGCLVGGAVLACAGVLWMEAVADRAEVET
jgi:tight adherence protein B